MERKPADSGIRAMPDHGGRDPSRDRAPASTAVGVLLLGDTHDTHSSSGRPRTIALRDGSLVTLRPATSDDEASLHSFLSGLCPAARRHRFFSAAADTACAAHLVAATGPD